LNRGYGTWAGKVFFDLREEGLSEPLMLQGCGFEAPPCI